MKVRREGNEWRGKINECCLNSNYMRFVFVQDVVLGIVVPVNE